MVLFEKIGFENLPTKAFSVGDFNPVTTGGPHLAGK